MRLLLFDIDGTLVLTGGAGSRAMTRAFAETHGLEDALQKVDLAGRTDRIIMRDALTHAGLRRTRTSTSIEFREAYCAALREEIQQPGNGRRGLLPGVRPLLDALAGRDDVRLALLTGNFRASAEIKLAAFDVWDYFTWGAFADDAIERDDLIRIAHARHETEHGHAHRARRGRRHRRHAARHPLRPRRRRQGGRGGDRQLRPRGAPRPPAGRAVRRPHRHRRGARRAAALSSPSARTGRCT